MKYYEDFLKLNCFTFSEAQNVVGNENATRFLLEQYISKGYVAKIRRGLYLTINLLDKEPTANKFKIASTLSETAAVSHRSAFEYYGYSNQVSHNVSVTSDSKFNPFEFSGFYYHRMTPYIQDGIVRTAGGITVTDIERTVLDSINDFENDMGFEELIRCLTAIPLLNEARLEKYLSEYDKCFMYQKVGFIFEIMLPQSH